MISKAVNNVFQMLNSNLSLTELMEIDLPHYRVLVIKQ